MIMEITELMIGDIVQYLDGKKLITVVVVKPDGSGNVVRLKQKNGHKFNTTVDYLRPVCVTKSLLEHIGADCYDSFARIELGRYYVIYDYDGFVTICDDEDNVKKISYLNCDYVHELQHAFSLCKINKQISLP